MVDLDYRELAKMPDEQFVGFASVIGFRPNVDPAERMENFRLRVIHYLENIDEAASARPD